MFTNVQWNCVPQNLNLHPNRERVAKGPVAHIPTSRGRRIGKTFTTAKAINCNSSTTTPQSNEGCPQYTYQVLVSIDAMCDFETTTLGGANDQANCSNRRRRGLCSTHREHRARGRGRKLTKCRDTRSGCRHPR